MNTLRRLLKWSLLILGGLLIIVVGLGTWFLWPRSYPKTYLTTAANRVPRGLALTANEHRATPFYVGTIGDPARLAELDAVLPSDFNSVTPENATKWLPLHSNHRLGSTGEPVYDFTAADRLVDHCLQKGVRIRGHNLVWGRFLTDEFTKDVEARLQAAPDRKEAMRSLLRNHIRTVMHHFRGRIREWDVLNEPLAIFSPELDKTIWQQTLGDGYIAEVFRMAREADPDAVLVLNEQLERYDDAHAERLLTLLAELVRDRVPIDVLGLESHVTVKRPSGKELHRFLERVAQLGLRFELTEIDVRLRIFGDAADPYEAQGEYMAELVRTAASFPECRGVTFWGLSDRGTWLDEFFPFKYLKPNEPVLFDAEGVRKPAYWAVERALTNAGTFSPSR